MDDFVKEWVARLMSPIILPILGKGKECWNAILRVWGKRNGCWVAVFGAMILLVIVMGVLWSLGASVITLLGVAVIAYFIVNLMLGLANYQKKQFEQLKNREVAIYQEIIKKWEERLFRETQTISQEWLKQWDEGVKQWERSVLEIKNLEYISEPSGQQHPMVKDICAQGYTDILLLYEKALKKEFTSEQHEKINDVVNTLMGIETFKQNYLKTVQLMKESGIIDEEFGDPLAVDPHTKETKYKPAMLVFHWWLYVIDEMIIDLKRQKKEEKSKSMCEKQEAIGSYQDDIFTNTEYEKIKKIVDRLPSEYEWLLLNKKDILSLLRNISDGYNAARETFLYYKELIETVKEGYIAFDKDCCHSTVKSKIDACREQDKNREKGCLIAGRTLTFEEAYKLGVREWMKVSNEKFGNQLVFWKMLIEIENSREKLRYIIGDEKVKELEETIDTEKNHFDIKLREAIFEDKDFYYNKSYAHFIGFLQSL
ncbi:hypothetical protein [Bartonella sp. SD1336NMGDW]|uniref:hypothetical protein n=1 Tax=Bartonella sp. SD1336NMGDW TaxID=3243575 RepID=UPI0035CEF7CD